MARGREEAMDMSGGDPAVQMADGSLQKTEVVPDGCSAKCTWPKGMPWQGLRSTPLFALVPQKHSSVDNAGS